MSIKPYDSSLLVGRFQIFHIGHESLVEIARTLSDRPIIFVGSAQESGTLRNPWNVSTRIKVIKAIYGDSVQVYALSDLTHEDDITTDWGKYVLENVDRYLYKAPEVMVYGNDVQRSGWFDIEDIKNTLEIIVPRSKINISATELRKMMVLDQRKEWMKWVNPKIHKMYDELRAELLAIKVYQDLREEWLKAS